MGYPLVVMVPHAVEILLMKNRTQNLTNSRLTRYEQVILAAENVTLKICNLLNPATLLPLPLPTNDESESECEHDCLNITEGPI